jgi:hypothetical protein
MKERRKLAAKTILVKNKEEMRIEMIVTLNVLWCVWLVVNRESASAKHKPTLTTLTR